MAKELKTSVKLDTRSAEKNLTRLAKKINDVQKAIDRTSNNNKKLTTAVNQATTATNRLNTATNRVANATNKVANTARKVNTETVKAANSADRLSNGYKKAGGAASFLVSKVKALAATYLGVMGMKALINTSDIITSAENRLNNLDGANPEQTAKTMDKIYLASQRARTGYTDMMANVSKTMTLAGDAFQGNIDNAIRFQEIMAKSYTVGGASAAEQASSMYQLVQALGSGVLQGDELRSVREGAPIAYKEIEKFAQGVYKTEESLKDLASQGKITSDRVVAAIMDAEEKINKSFENTSMTFAQAWSNIKNTAVKAFEPVMQMMNDALNSDAGRAIINGIGQALVWLANIILWIGGIFGNFFNWCADNWYWLQWIVFAVVTALVIYFGVMAAKAIWAGLQMLWAFLTGLSPLTWAIIIIGVVVASIVWLANTTADACDFIFGALMIVALGILLIGIITGSTALMILSIVIALVALLLLVFMEWGEQICGGIRGIVSVIGAACDNIGIFFTNLWNDASAKFWDLVSTILSGLKSLEPAFNALAKLFGIEGVSFSGLAEGASAKANASRSKIQSYNSISGAWDTGYQKGANWASGMQNNINALGSKLKSSISGFSVGDLLSGVGSSGTFSAGALPNAYDSTLGLGSYDPAKALDNIGKGVGDTAGNTGKMADSMDLAEEDLEYLRKLADMEWKKEFTTASITVDMSNYNTFNGESDLDGIVTRLTDRLYEELDSVANGVYA